jgi:hypothetical protein
MAEAAMSIPMGQQALQMLTIFPITGWAGLNLFATGMPILSMFKAGSYVLGLVIATFVGAIYPSVFSFIFWCLMKVVQWYIFDVVDIMDPMFKDSKSGGFRPPFHLPLPPYLRSFSETVFCSDPAHDCGRSGEWKLTFPLFLLIAAALAAYGFTWANQLPTQYQAYAQYFTGGGSALLASGGVLSSLYSAQTAASLVASKSIGASGSGVTLPTLLPGVPSISQFGGAGGRKGLPPLSSFAKTMKESYSQKALDDSGPFLAILAYICAAGFGMSLVRNRMV